MSKSPGRGSTSLIPGVIYEWTPKGTAPVDPVVDPASFESEPALTPLVPGAEVVAGYRLEERIGECRTGEVWRATGPGGVDVALKFIEADQHGSERELRSLVQMLHVRHANLVTIFGVWERDDWTVIGMDLADGSLLDRFESATRAGQPGLDFHELTDFLRQAARGIDFLNEPKHSWVGLECDLVGLVHRGIRPENILLVGGSVKVGDFALAKRLVGEPIPPAGPGDDGIESLLTVYSAPEVRRGSLSARADQYSLAATYCYLRSGQVAATPPDALGSSLEGGDDHPSDPIDLSMLPLRERPPVARALAGDPEKRWPTCSAFIEELVASARGPIPFQTRRPVVAPAGADSPSLWAGVRRVALAAFVALTTSATVALVWSDESPHPPVAVVAPPDPVEVLAPPDPVETIALSPGPDPEIHADSIVETASIDPVNASTLPPPSPPRFVDQIIAEPLVEVAAEVAPTPSPSGDEIWAAVQSWAGETRDRVGRRLASARDSVRGWVKALPRPAPVLVAKPVEPPAPKTASIIVRMPNSKAELVVRGEVGRGNPDEWYGPRRVIHSPPITGARDYLIGAFWTEPDGKQMTRSHPLKVEPGRLYEIDLRSANPTAVEVPRPPAP